MGHVLFRRWDARGASVSRWTRPMLPWSLKSMRLREPRIFQFWSSFRGPFFPTRSSRSELTLQKQGIQGMSDCGSFLEIRGQIQIHPTVTLWWFKRYVKLEPVRLFCVSHRPIEWCWECNETCPRAYTIWEIIYLLTGARGNSVQYKI